MSYRIKGLDPAPFRHLSDLSDAALAAAGVRRIAMPGMPDRIELRDVEPGESALLLNYVHQPAETPYKASHAIYVREGALTAYDAVDRIPPALSSRVISLRAFTLGGYMVDADLVDGMDMERLIDHLLDNAQVSYLQAHYAKHGCYAARVERA